MSDIDSIDRLLTTDKTTQELSYEKSLYFETENFISGPVLSENADISINILQFHHSFGYDCQRLFNLCVADPNTVIFASGNLIHFFDVEKNELSFRRCSTGKGIGHIAKNPSFNHIAVGENGKNPPIIIYEWPSLEIVTVLENGTTRSYSHLAYNVTGLLLASQGGAPDYLITIWNWQKSKIIIRCKSHNQEVYNIMFSPTVIDQLTSCGIGHIKFWKMAKTFTGLKLQGELGKFGKTEHSDIIGMYPMADEKVLSGVEWGNILVWDEGLIRAELCQKNRKPCHTNVITQFEYFDGDLISVGMDGWIKIWYYESTDSANRLSDDPIREMEPTYEFLVSEDNRDNYKTNSKLMCIQKKESNDTENSLWYAQDANGGLWLIDLKFGFDMTQEKPKQILYCHAGPITDMVTADWGPFIVTCGSDGRLHIYNYSIKTLFLSCKFNEPINKLLWFPSEIDESGCTLVCAFATGVLRIVVVHLHKIEQSENISYTLLQVLKPHKQSITCLTFNVSSSLLISGSEDSTIFIFQVVIENDYPKLIPIGFIKTPSIPITVSWSPQNDNTVLIGCSKGDCIEIDLPKEPQSYTTISFELHQCIPRIFKFQSVKSKIRRDLLLKDIEEKKRMKSIEKREELEKLILENPEIVIDEVEFLRIDEEDIQIPDLYVPDIPSSILIAHYRTFDKIWLFMSGFDSGFIYEYSKPSNDGEILQEPINSTMICDADDIEITNIIFFNEKYIFLGLKTGEIRVVKVNPKNPTDFSNYWSLTMHDNNNGFISSMKISCDSKMLFTSGYDGNLFSFNINDDELQSIKKSFTPKLTKSLVTGSVDDIEDIDYPTLEEESIKKEETRIANVIMQKKNDKHKILRNLSEEFLQIIKRNENLPKSQQIPPEELELDKRVTADLDNKLKEQMDLIHRKMAFQLEKSKLKYEKLYKHFIEPLTCMPFAVCKIL